MHDHENIVLATGSGITEMQFKDDLLYKPFDKFWQF
jgi:hypothetical protein